MKRIVFLFAALFLLVTCKKKEEPPAPTPQPSGPVTYKITYDGNGSNSGSVPVDGNNYDDGAIATVLANSGFLQKAGLTFIGWNSKADGSGSDHNPGEAITISKTNITLFAKWNDNSTNPLYRVTYMGNGNSSGTPPIDNTFYQSGSGETILSNSGSLAKKGNQFAGWSLNSASLKPSFLPGDLIYMWGNVTLYAVYTYSVSGSGGKYYGLNASGQLKSKSSLTSTWSNEDLNNAFGTSNVVTATWDGSKLIGFNASGQCKSKSTNASSWSSEDLNNIFGTSNVVAAVWNGSKYIGFNASGQCKSKSSLTSSWSSEDLSNTFGTSLVVSVVWNGTKYVGFNASGQCKSKSSLTASWSNDDLNNAFGTSNVVTVTWNGSKYIGFNASGQCKSKSSLTSTWTSEDLNNFFGTSNITAAVYH